MDDPNITMEEYIRLEEEKAIVFDETLTYDAALSYEPTVSPLNENKIYFRISFDESDDEDYTVIFDENSFSYKIILVDNLKRDSENDNDKVDIPSFPSPKPTVSYYDDLDYFKDFETEFPAIVYNDALTSKLDSLTEPAVSPHHIDELDLKNDTSLSKHDEQEQNIVYFNDLFPLNMIYLDNLETYKDNNDDEIDIIQSSGDMTPLTPREQRHPWLRYQVEGYIEDIVHNFEQRLETIFGRSVNRVHVLDFVGLTEEMRQTLADWLRMVYTRDEGQELFLSHAWRRLFEIRGPLLGGARHMMTWRQFILALGLHTTEEMADDGHVEGRKSGARLFEVHFIGRLAAHFGLVSDEELRGLSVITRELLMIDLHELVRLNICMRLGDTWAWVAPSPERQLAAAFGALEHVEGAHDERLSMLEYEVHSLRGDMGEQRGVLDSMAHDFFRFTTWTITILSRMMDESRVR
ncbi:hypothetical protein Tco_0635504 [Tanacetum coccineum]